MEKTTKRHKITAALQTGAIGGAFWSLMGYIAYFINFSSVGPSIFIRPFVTKAFADRPLAQFMGIGAAMIFGIVFALLYAFTLSRFYQPWLGIGCGAALFVLFYYVIAPMFSITTKPLHHLGSNTFSTQLSLFILFGLFVGFSLSAEFSSKEEPAKAE
jgi:hypothetical protein